MSEKKVKYMKDLINNVTFTNPDDTYVYQIVYVTNQ